MLVGAFKMIICFILGAIVGACFYAICSTYGVFQILIYLEDSKNWKHNFYQIGSKWCDFIDKLSRFFIQDIMHINYKK